MAVFIQQKAVYAHGSYWTLLASLGSGIYLAIEDGKPLPALPEIIYIENKDECANSIGSSTVVDKPASA